MHVVTRPRTHTQSQDARAHAQASSRAEALIGIHTRAPMRRAHARLLTCAGGGASFWPARPRAVQLVQDRVRR
eukprot:3178284-Pleurochrysis_carterae.AAC.1